jgi:hypothetical protein
MKKLTLLIIVMLLIGLFVGCQSKETIYQTNFKNKEFNFSFRIPKKWEGKYKAIEGETDKPSAYLTFEYTGHSDKDGKHQPFFSIIPNKEGFSMKEENNIGKYDGIYYFIMMYKLNNITDKSKSKEYDKLYLSQDEIKSRFSIENK